MYSYTKSNSSPSKQYPNSFTKFGWETLPRKFTSHYTEKKNKPSNKQTKLCIAYIIDISLEYSTHLPFLKSLEAFGVKFLDSNHSSSAVTPRPFLFKPAFEDFPKPSFSQNILRLEIPGCSSKFCKAEYP